MRVWVEVSQQRLVENLRVLEREVAHAAAPGVPPPAVLAVVKANAYGHRARICAPILARAGTEWLGVTDAAEGIAVRAALADLHPRILVMCGLTQDEAVDLVRHNLTPILWQPESLPWLSEQARATTQPIPIHLEIDTGMGRQGCLPGPELAAFLKALLAHPQIRLEGVMTHFASTEVAASPQTASQQQAFEAALQQVAASGHRLAWVHAGNSSFLDNQRSAPANELVWLQRLARAAGARAMVRSGLALYGHTLPIDRRIEGQTNDARLQPRLQPVLTWKTRITAIRHIAAGTAIGYNGIFLAPHPMRLAVLPSGYADGLRRELSSTNTKAGGWVTIHGIRAPIVGRVSMNITMADVTHIPTAATGDEAILLGEGITAEDHARLAHTIPYEILCGLREG